MVPSICPLETLHNSLSLKQVDEFLASVAAPSRESLQETCTDFVCNYVHFKLLNNLCLVNLSNILQITSNLKFCFLKKKEEII